MWEILIGIYLVGVLIVALLAIREKVGIKDVLFSAIMWPYFICALIYFFNFRRK